jgi:BirA family biotin operon repressor/biotin-[acetyl-CoA-carboxylase] ligase
MAKFCSMDDVLTKRGSRLAALLETKRLGRDARVFDQLDSTQDEARRLAAEGCAEGVLVWAQEQTAGRGRLDRRWLSPPGAGLLFSVVLRPPLPPEAAAFLTIAAGVGVASALREVVGAGPAIRLKWPNDAYLDGRKLGGILAEAEVAGGAVAHVVLGVGINLLRPPGGYDPGLENEPAALSDALGSYALLDQAVVLARILGGIEGAYDLVIADELERVRRRWVELSDTIGRPVRAELDGGLVEGTAVDLAPDGGLVIEAGGQRLTVRSGEVLHLR